MKRTNVFLGDEDRARIDRIRAAYALTSDGQAIRVALKLAEQEARRATRRADDGRPADPVAPSQR